MKYVPQPPITSDHIFIGSIKLIKGDNILTTSQLNVIKKHPAYKYYCEKGMLVPSSQEQKPNGKERAAAKKEENKAQTKLPLADESTVEEVKIEESAESVKSAGEEKPKRRRTSRKKTETPKVAD